MAWTDSLANESLRTLTAASIADGSVNYNEMLGLLNTSSGGGFSGSELADLRLVYANVQSLFSSDYLRAITYDVLYGNPGNARWWGGARTLGGTSVLGDTTANGTELNAQRLVGKWFLGTDWPMPVAGGDTATGKASTQTFSYAQANGPLFVNGVQASDINQGQLGDCYLVAALGVIANARPAVITSLFTANPNGTYGVTFYNDGARVYTTVDSNLAVDTQGRLAFAGNATKSTGGELWVSLAEKAYAQLNTQFDVDSAGTSWSGENSYQAVEGGFAQVFKQVANVNYRYYSSYYSDLPDSYDSGVLLSTNAATYKQTLVTALQSGAMGWLGSWGQTTGANGKKELISGHAFMLLGYNAATDKFILRNPWGGDGSGSYNVQFEVSIETFWNPTVKAVVALSDAAAADPVYGYTLTSNAATSGAAVSEGQSVTFTITRSASGTTSTVYLGTIAGSAGNADYQALNKQTVTFAANELIKSVSVPVYQDGLAEGTETFSAAVYLNSADSASVATTTAYVKDVASTGYSYGITSDAGSTANAAAEGGSVTFTITRSGTGSESTVYLSTLAGSAGTADYVALDRQVLTFSAFETVKTVRVAALLDGLTEGTENYALGLFPNFTDAAPAVRSTAYIRDAVDPVYDYTITSNADSAASAMAEGGKVKFSIVRGGSGSSSTVYLSTIAGSAGNTDYVALDRKAVTFAANQTVATVDVDLTEDWWLETVEYFRLGLYKNSIDTTPSASGTAYIKDATVSAFNYTVTSAAGSAATAVTEGANAVFTLTRSGTGAASTVYVSTASGSADTGSDYAAVTRQAVTFADFETTKTVSVATYQDGKTEGAEYFLLNLFRNYSDPAASTYGRAYITDPAASVDYGYSVSSSAPAGSAVIEGGNVTFTITRSSSGTASTVYVDTNTSNGSAIGDTDYRSLARVPVTFAAFETSKTVTVPTYQDTLVEGDEYFYLLVFKNVTDPFSAYAAWTSAHIQDPVATVSYDYTVSTTAGSSTAAVTEGAAVTFTLTRKGSGTVSTVYVDTSSGTATVDTDLAGIKMQAVQFAAFETTKTITVNTYQDNLAEGTEFFWLDLYKSYTDTDAAAWAAAYVKDPAVAANYGYTLSTTAGSEATAVTEGGAVTFTITRSASGTSSTVYVDTHTGNETATGDVDYAGLTRKAVAFAANEISKTVTVETYADTLVEGAESFYLLLFKNVGDPFSAYAAYATAYVKDPAQNVSYEYTVSTTAASAASAVTEGSPVTFNVTRNGSGTVSTVYVDTHTGNETATGDVDYTSLSRQAVTFAAGETSKAVTVNTTSDTLIEGAEFFYLLLFKNVADPFSAYASFASAYVKDPPVSVNYSYTLATAAGSAASAVTEGDPVTFTITRSSSGTASTVYVDTHSGNETATGDIDYASLTRQAVNFAANETSKTVSVGTTKDALNEGTESFYLLLFKNQADAFADYAAYTTAYIKDPVVVNYSYTMASTAGTTATAVVEGNAVSFTLTRSGSGTVSTVYVDTHTTNETATGGADYTSLTRQAVTFAANETSKTVTVDTYKDGLTENAEFFNLLLYKNVDDPASSFVSYATAYVKDPPAAASYSYVLSSSAATASTAVTEGSPVVFTITRNGSGSASTVYVDTNTGNETATGGIDYVKLARQAVTFAANETVKTVAVSTTKDNVTEGDEYFYLLLYKNAGDAFDAYVDFGIGHIRDAVGGLGSGAEAFVLGAAAATALAASAPAGTPVVAYPNHTLGEYKNASAFAVIKADGSVVAWGDPANGGDTSSVGAALNGTVPVQQIYSDSGAFAALRADGSVVAWGNAQKGGSLTGAAAAALNGSTAAKQVYATQSAFAALRADGSVVTWGDLNFGGDSGNVAPALSGVVDVREVASNSAAFAALRVDGSVVTWGYSSYGGDSGAVAAALSGTRAVQKVYSTSGAFAALLADGAVVTWGSPGAGGNSSAVTAGLSGAVDVTVLASTSTAFAALRADGSVVSWGDPNFGGDTSAVTSDVSGANRVVSLAATAGAFAALRADGSVVTWGYAAFGGDSSGVASALNGSNDVVALVANKTAFAALRADGSVVTWGAAGSGGDSTAVSSSLNGAVRVERVVATDSAFATLRTDGSVVAWGDFFAGGDASSVQVSLNSSVTDLYSTASAFAARRSDGTVVTWGDLQAGGDSSAVRSQLRTVVAGADILSADNLTMVFNGTAGADALAGGIANDTLQGYAGNDNVNGAAGIDTAVFAARRGESTLQKTAIGWTVTTPADGTDTLVNVERARFSDTSVALDLSGSAGTVAKILGAVFGVAALGRKDYAGIGLRYLDGGSSYAELVQTALGVVPNSQDHATLVKLLYGNVVGVQPGPDDLAYFVGLLDSGVYTPASITQFACDIDLNLAHIDLAGLTTTGLAYTPWAG